MIKNDLNCLFCLDSANKLVKATPMSVVGIVITVDEVRVSILHTNPWKAPWPDPSSAPVLKFLAKYSYFSVLLFGGAE